MGNSNGKPVVFTDEGLFPLLLVLLLHLLLPTTRLVLLPSARGGVVCPKFPDLALLGCGLCGLGTSTLTYPIRGGGYGRAWQQREVAMRNRKLTRPT
jgi:hypothetical protein